MISQVEPELMLDAPRPVRMTAEGGRRLVFATVPIVTTLALALLLLVARPRPLWREGLFTAFFLVGIGVLYLVISRWLLRARLVEQGVPVASTIAAKETWHGNSAHYYCWYEADGKRFGLGWAGHQDELEVGDLVTVLYLADDPARAVPYCWAGCEVAVDRAGLEDLRSVEPHV